MAQFSGVREPGVDRRIDRGIDPADEEARHAGDRRRIAAARDQRLESADVGLRGALVGFLREEQRDVDVVPSAINWRIAGMPSGVAGTLIIRLSRPTAAHSRRASASVPAVSAASGGDTSRDT
jgi:hypothetical protein